MVSAAILGCPLHLQKSSVGYTLAKIDTVGFINVLPSRSRMTVDLRMPTFPGRTRSALCTDQVDMATTNRVRGGFLFEWMR